MIRVLSLALFISCLASISCTAQTYSTLETASKKSVKAYHEAEQLRHAGEFSKAVSKFETLQKSDPSFIDVPLILADIYFLNLRVSEATQEFERAVALDSFYMPRALYSLGRIYLKEGEYHHARILLQRYLDRGSPTGDHKANAESYLERAQTAEYLVAHPVAFDPEPIPGPVNTPESEALPAFTVDGAYMLFTRRTGGQEDMYIARWDSTSSIWASPQPLSEVNTSMNEGAHAVSADGSMIAFTACSRSDGVGSCDIYFWQRKNGVWQRPVNAGGINSRGWDGHPALTADGRGMYFSSDRPGGIGGRDIWYTERHGDQWTIPINLGTPVNTTGDEESPFLFFDNRTLYFMSDGHPGLGDSDLFMTSKIGNTWSAPKNLGYPINTLGKEGALAVHPDRRYAYYTSDRNGGQNDIYRFKLDSSLLPPPISNLQGYITDVSTSKALISDVIIYDLSDSTEVFRYSTDADGRFSAAILHGRTYGIHVTSPGYVFWSGQASYDISEPYGQKVIRVALTPVKQEETTAQETPVVLRNIEFQTGSAALLSSSMTELKTLLSLLQENPGMRVEIRGHTDNVGSDTDNQILSEARARAVYDWLVDHGIAISRLTYKGFGETMPVASNDTNAGRQQNRRTEFVILKSQ